MSDKQELKPNRFECDDCADAEGYCGIPCVLTSHLIHENQPLLCPVSGQECDFINVSTPDTSKAVSDAEAFLSKMDTITPESITYTDRELLKLVAALIADNKAKDKQVAEADGSCSQLITERDQRESQITEAYTALGGTDEWSNLHDLGEDLIGMIADLKRQLALCASQNYCTMCGETLDGYMRDETIDKLKAQIETLRGALESIAGNTCCDRCQEAALVATKALKSTEPVSPWVKVEDRLPEGSCRVLIRWETKPDKKTRTSMGWYARQFQVVDEGEYFEYGEYDDATDEYYFPEGWWEVPWESEVAFPLSEVTHWMPIPPTPDK